MIIITSALAWVFEFLSFLLLPPSPLPLQVEGFCKPGRAEQLGSCLGQVHRNFSAVTQLGTKQRVWLCILIPLVTVSLLRGLVIMVWRWGGGQS